MNKNLTCNQVEALMNLYIDGKLSSQMSEYVKLHLNTCNHCKMKFEELKSILSKYDNVQSKPQKQDQYLNDEFLNNLSAYVDNELNSDDNIKIKKMTISNPNARKKLETMYHFKKLMFGAYQKTKNDYKMDYSKSIIAQVIDHDTYSSTCFQKLLILFCVMLIAIIVGFLYLYF